MRSANLAVKFLLELAAFASLGYAGARLFHGVWSVAAAVLFPSAAIVVWGLWCAPRSSRRLPPPARIPLELGIFAVSAVLLGLAGAPVLALVLAAVMAVNAVLLTTLHQWES